MKNKITNLLYRFTLQLHTCQIPNRNCDFVRYMPVLYHFKYEKFVGNKLYLVKQESKSTSRFGSSSAFEGRESPVSLSSRLKSSSILFLWIFSWSSVFDYVQVREEPPSYSTSVMQRFESFENPLGGQSFNKREDEESTGNPQFGKALYDFTAGGEDEVKHAASWWFSQLLSWFQFFEWCMSWRSMAASSFLSRLFHYIYLIISLIMNILAAPCYSCYFLFLPFVFTRSNHKQGAPVIANMQYTHYPLASD